MTLLLLGLAAPLCAQQGAPGGADPASPPSDKRPRMICKQDAKLGTKIAKTICMTWPEWQARERESNDEARRFLDRAEAQGSAVGAATAGGSR